VPRSGEQEMNTEFEWGNPLKIGPVIDVENKRQIYSEIGVVTMGGGRTGSSSSPMTGFDSTGAEPLDADTRNL
jgi:hypothetical protein